MHSTWPQVADETILDTPNMHPRASIVSEIVTDRLVADYDKPPDYESALINSKPISWIVAAHKEEQAKLRAEDQARAYKYLDAKRDSDLEYESNSEARRSLLDHDSGSRNGPHKVSSSDNMTQLALSIVRGFTSETPQQVALANNSESSEVVAIGRDGKTSYCQLDVEQLIDQGSPPPEYCRITMPRTDQDSTSNQSSESRDGAKPNN